MKILLLCSGFNGLSQRVWIELTEAGHDVHTHLADGDDGLRRAVAEFDPDLVICPFLRERVPAEVWSERRTIIIHPGPMGDRGPSSLDWAITDRCTALGCHGACRPSRRWTPGRSGAHAYFPLDATPPRKSQFVQRSWWPTPPPNWFSRSSPRRPIRRSCRQPLDYGRLDVIGRLRPMMRQADRSFSWSDSTERDRATDPCVRTDLPACTRSCATHPLPSSTPNPASALGRPTRHDRTAAGTAPSSSVPATARRGWGTSRPAARRRQERLKLPATMGLGDRLTEVPEVLPSISDGSDGYKEISYRRVGAVGVLTFDFYNGAMSTGQCRRLARALRHAAAQDTTRAGASGGDVFSNGIHLERHRGGVDPATEAWRNINAIDDVCREIITCTHQLVVPPSAATQERAG